MRPSAVALMVGFAAAPLALAQVGDYVTIQEACSYFGERPPTQAMTFSSDREAEDTIRRIVDASGLAQNFEVKAAGVPNASAVVQTSKRYILYNQYFMIETRRKTGNQWAPVSIMAHEIGHHLNGHTLDATGSRPKIELEADYYSGFILQRMGASIDDARSAMQSLGSATGSQTHPGRDDRLAAITNGWTKACSADPRCSTSSEPRGQTRDDPPAPAPSRPEPPRRTTRDDDEADSCRYANDGECDEPDLCDPGTDTADCRATRRARPQTRQQPAVATMCVTAYGNCPMVQAIPVGSACTCYTVWGPIAGIAR
jgi:hypothetical protein